MSDFNRILNPLKAKIRGLVIRGLVVLVDDSSGIQRVKVSGMAGELKQGVERLQQYGHSSNPPGVTEAVLVCLGGDRDNMVCIGTDSRLTRKKNLQPGESTIYNGLTGASVLLNLAGEAIVEALTFVKLGGSSAFDPVIRKSDLVTIFGTGVPVANDGGASLKAAWASAAASSGSTKVFSA